jgi:chromosome condensin MukBEF ATPase and DNA-binding subunit MukB
MSLRQLRTRIEHLEAKSPAHNEERAARARWEELRLRQWKQTNRRNEVEKPLTEEEKVELKELTYRFDRFAKKNDEMAKMYEEAAAEWRQKEWPRKKAAAPK